MFFSNLKYINILKSKRIGILITVKNKNYNIMENTDLINNACSLCNSHENNIFVNTGSTQVLKYECSACKIENFYIKCYFCDAVICDPTYLTQFNKLQCLNCLNEIYNIFYHIGEITNLTQVYSIHNMLDNFNMDKIVKGVKLLINNINIQIVNCAKCRNTMIYNDKYHEGQKINCLYCSYEFFLLECSFCLVDNVFDKTNDQYFDVIGNLGKNCERVECFSCKQKFTKWFCIKCDNIMSYDNRIFRELVKKLCTKCEESYYFIKCSDCGEITITVGINSYYHGQEIKCSNPECKKNIFKVSCAFCYELNDPEDFMFGTSFICEDCNHCFTHLICYFCERFNIVKNEYKEGQGFICYYKKCVKSSYNCTCPFCNRLILLDRYTYQFGNIVKCPYTECELNFQYLYCVHCGVGIYYKNCAYSEGDTINCKKCNFKFQFLYCAYCSRGLQYGQGNVNSNSLIECLYEDCKAQFYIENVHNSCYQYSKGINFSSENGTFIELLSKPTKYSD